MKLSILSLLFLSLSAMAGIELTSIHYSQDTLKSINIINTHSNVDIRLIKKNGKEKIIKRSDLGYSNSVIMNAESNIGSIQFITTKKKNKCHIVYHQIEESIGYAERIDCEKASMMESKIIPRKFKSFKRINNEDEINTLLSSMNPEGKSLKANYEHDGFKYKTVLESPDQIKEKRKRRQELGLEDYTPYTSEQSISFSEELKLSVGYRKLSISSKVQYNNYSNSTSRSALSTDKDSLFYKRVNEDGRLEYLIAPSIRELGYSSNIQDSIIHYLSVLSPVLKSSESIDDLIQLFDISGKRVCYNSTNHFNSCYKLKTRDGMSKVSKSGNFIHIVENEDNSLSVDIINSEDEIKDGGFVNFKR